MFQVRFGLIVFLVASLAAVGQLANTIYVPAMTMIAHSLHIRPELVQALMTAYLLPYGITQFVYGPLSDIFGRRPLVLFGLVIFVIGSVLAALANDFQLLFIGCVVQGLGAGVAGVMARTVMRDCYTEHKLYKANSYVSVALIFAPLAAPIIGGLLSVYFGWRADFLFLIVFSGMVLFLEYYLFPETHIARKVENRSLAYFVSAYRNVLSEKIFLGYMLCLMLTFGGFAVFEASAGVLLTNILHFPPKIVSILFIVPIPGYLLGSYLASYLNRYFTLSQILNFSLVIILFATLLLAVPAFLHVLNIYIVIIPITFYMFGSGLLFPTAVTGALNPLGQYAGTAGAVLGGMQNIGAAMMTFAFSLIPQTTQRPLALMLCISAGLLVPTVYFLLHVPQKSLAQAEVP